MRNSVEFGHVKLVTDYSKLWTKIEKDCEDNEDCKGKVAATKDI